MSIKPTLLIITLLSILPSFSMATADRIVLKDGTVEQSDRIWESEDYYHFILKGTKNVEIRFTKTIVDHIERDSPGQSPKTIVSLPTIAVTPVGKNPVDKADKANNVGLEGDNQPTHPLRLPDEKVVMANKGIAFYDPRRKDRYWVTRQSRHSTLKNAIEAISKLYGRSSKWVEDHMGDANDLGAIHNNLIGQIKREQSQTGANGGKNSAIESTAGGAGPSTQIQPIGVQEPPGEERASAGLPHPQIAKGVLFYDPRRDEKYWSGQMTRHNTLQDAIRALADQYHVSEQWISNHMGETNDLAEIHRNIQNSLNRSLSPSN